MSTIKAIRKMAIRGKPAPAPRPVVGHRPRARRAPMRHVRLAAPFDGLFGPLPPEVAAIPSMMTEHERRFIFNLARNYYLGEGRIVDAGLFLGASTCCFGAGLRANPRSCDILAHWPRPIVSLEQGTVNPGMLAFFKRHSVASGLNVGESFVPVLEKHISPWRDLVDLRVGDIRATGAVSEPVEILFLDVLKLPAISEYAIRQYFPRLLPGRSVVVQQDYLIDELPYIRTHQEFFGAHFEFLGEIASSAIFRCTAPITQADIEALFSSPLSVDSQLRLATAAMRRSLDPYRRMMLALSRVRMIHQLQGIKVAQRYLDALERQYARQIQEMQLKRVHNALRAVRQLCQRL
ncbi:MAG: hypothetical protein ISP90_03500 [Nevskia sp.]|nr:hypothetical protein [Nevskia sp.]